MRSLQRRVARMKVREIKRVRGFWIGQEVERDGNLCEIVQFPSRSMVVLKTGEKEGGDWVTTEVPVEEISRV